MDFLGLHALKAPFHKALRAVPIHDFTRPGMRRSDTRGFTMLELLAVIIVLALVAALSPPLFSSGVTGAEHRAAARQVAQVLRFARTEAVAKRVDVGVEFDFEARTFQLADARKKSKLPEGIALELTTTAAETKDEKRGSIRFYPDGGSTGGRVTLKNKERQFRIDIDWLTGRVAIDDA
ncbi:MAG: type II secretion system protein GspH [Betaproteobacteria bacterium]|nr:MAG: type II secretion system protein GspH [Betaproteobacteria bacterium]